MTNKLTLEYLKEITRNPIKIKSMIEFKKLFINKNIALLSCDNSKEIKQNQNFSKLQRIENNFSNINYVIRELKEIRIKQNLNNLNCIIKELKEMLQQKENLKRS